MHMNKCSSGIAPEGGRKPRLCHCGGDTFCQSAVAAFSHTILMRFISNGVLTNNTSISKECLKLIGHIIPSLIITHGFDFVTQQVLSISLKALECPKHFTLPGKKDNTPEA
jgi:hypothetical protein